MPADSVVQLSLHGLDGRGARLALLTLNRPDQLNPLDHAMVLALRAGLSEAVSADGVRLVAFTGAGRAFSAGGDMKQYLRLQSDPVVFPRFLSDVHELFDSLSACPLPVIALVNGIALAGGLELVLACDVAIAAESARIGDAHLPYGQMGGGGVLSRLPRRIGSQRARELIFSGRLLPAQEAAEWGLVNRAVPDDQLLRAGLDLGTELAAKSPLAIANVKKVLHRAEFDGLDLASSLAYEREVTVDYCLHSRDAREGLEAFSAKRQPQFTGE
jgi:enoyl-CoA hydratase/carnithine racemase